VKSIAVFLTILLGIVAGWAIAWEGGSERPAGPVYQLAEGDIVFQANISPQHEAIRQATGSPYTHCGVVFRRGGKLVVYEASQPVRATTIETFQSRSLRGTFLARRPKVPLDPGALATARRWSENQLGRRYDFRFLWNDETLYCSEFVWKAYEKAGVTLCPTRRFRDYHLHAPAVARVIKERYGSADRLPGEEPVVSPGDLAVSDMLVDVPRAEGAGR